MVICCEDDSWRALSLASRCRIKFTVLCRLVESSAIDKLLQSIHV